MSEKLIKIAIDGPAASGKSTTARMVAQKLDYTYIDSGAMYRAVTLKTLQNKVSPTDADKVVEIAAKITIEFQYANNDIEVIMDGEDISKAIRTPDVTNNIGPVAANLRVREILVNKQRMLGRNGGVVMDGRDITTVVFPDAELKVYMKASSEERARRRVKELMERGIKADYNEILQSIIDRDQADFSRNYGPLKQAPDAVVIDTTELKIEEQVEKIYHLALKILQKISGSQTR
jgi:cytidylate kinase